MNYVGPLAFNAVRFALGAVSLIPLIYWRHRRSESGGKITPFSLPGNTLVTGGLLAGVAVFGGASLQQIGIVYTTAGKAGFITGLYVIIVPILGLLRKQRTASRTWIGALLAVAGLYLLSVTGDFRIAAGDLLVLAGAFFWAGHVHLIGWFSPRTDTLHLAFWQFFVCSLLSFAAALIFEDFVLSAFMEAALPVLYAGVMSVGIAYTLQVVAQKSAHPAHAAIILSLESAFAAFGGWLILNEVLSFRELSGCLLMLSGMLVSQLPQKQKRH